MITDDEIDCLSQFPLKKISNALVGQSILDINKESVGVSWSWGGERGESGRQEGNFMNSD